MVVVNEISHKDKREYFFEFKGESYRVHSVVKLTDKAQMYLGFADREVILTEVYYHLNGRKMWKYQGKDIAYNIGVRNKSTDTPPDEIIEKIVESASADYASREILGTNSPVYTTNATKHTKKDWEIPELKREWIIFILVFIGVSIFQDWYIQLILRIIAGWIFGLRRQAYVKAYTTYTHDEDNDILKKKFEILYGLKSNKEDNNNE